MRSFTGYRAQLVNRAGELVDDIVVRGSAGTVHVLNALSPALTCGFPFGEGSSTGLFHAARGEPCPMTLEQEGC